MSAVRLGDLFNVDYGQSFALNKLTAVEAGTGIAFVSRTAKNNGIAGWVERVQGVDPLPAGLLTVCLRSRNHALSTFVQPAPFYTAFHVYVLTPKASMSIQEKIWWSRCIEGNRYRYNFGRQANRTLADLEVPDAVPDWVTTTKIPIHLEATESPLPLLDTDKWQEYTLGDLFAVKRGRNILKRSMLPGATPYISAIAHSNGIAARISEPAEHPADCITVVSNGNGGMGYSFYQPAPFIASGDVTVLMPKRPLGVQAGLFLCTIISAERYRWHFNRKWSTTRIRDSVVKLPSRVSGGPDWEFMETYMRRLRLASVVFSRSSDAA